MASEIRWGGGNLGAFRVRVVPGPRGSGRACTILYFRDRETALLSVLLIFVVFLIAHARSLCRLYAPPLSFPPPNRSYDSCL